MSEQPSVVGALTATLPRGGEGEGRLLEVADLAVAYSGVQTLWGISISVGRGEVVALVGANGAGKTTTLRAISGMVHVLGGSVRLDGVELVGRPTHEIVERGAVH